MVGTPERSTVVILKRPFVLASWFAAGLLILTFGSTGLNWIYHGHVASQLDRIEEKEMEMISSSWISGGSTVTITTTHDTGNETFVEFLRRHKADVATAQLEFPVDAGSSSGD